MYDFMFQALLHQIAELESKVTDLSNKQAELEEEKGNLLLRLEAIDEHQGEILTLFS